MHAVQLFFQQIATLRHVLLASLALEPLADPLFGGGALDEVQPVAAGTMRRFRGEDLDDLTVLEVVVQRDHAPVDLRAHASVSDLGVDAVREIHRGRAGRQVQHITLRREHVNLVLEEVDLHRVDEGLGVPHLGLPLEEAAQPRELLVEARVLLAFLVGPVRRHAELGDAVHLLGADLDLDGFAGVGDHGGVQRLIAV